MKKILLSFALTVGLLTSASTLQAQVNMSRYITLTVKNGAAIKLDFMAAAAGTPVRIVSGSNTQNITVGTSWFDSNWPRTYTVTAQGTEMKVYGDITQFYCSENGVNLTALDVSHNTQLKGLDCSTNQLTSLDVSHNTQLKWLWCSSNQLTSLDVSKNTQLYELSCYANNLTSLNVSKNTQLKWLFCRDNNLTTIDVSGCTQLKELDCYNNDFTTTALDDIYCSLPDRTGTTYGKIQPIKNSSSSYNDTVLATNAQNATSKNWKVQYADGTDIPATTGTYVCSGGGSEPNMNSYITLTVKKDSAIKLGFLAAADGTPVRIVSGSNTQDITVNTYWYSTGSYTADTTMIIYGDIIGFGCSINRANLTALDPSHNTQLERLDCSYNNLTSLNLSQNTLLKELNCSGNLLTTLDLSNNTLLKELNCSGNQLTTLDLSNDGWLKELSCSGNNFSTQALDDIYCSLPDRTSKSRGVIKPVFNSSDPNHATVLATNKANAISKNWKVRYSDGDTDIPATTGTYVCGTPHPVDTSRYITLTVSNGEVIKLDFKAAAANTSVRIKSGITDTTITVGTSWKGITSYTAADSVMTVYGDIIVFYCSNNRAKLTAIDLSHHTQLTELYCTNNKITSLDVSNNTQLTGLYCTSNQLSSLNASGCTQLKTLNCVSNQLLSLNVSGCTQLTKVECFSNRLSSLDVSGYTQLKELNCHGNQLSNINVSGCTQLKELKCYNNQLASLNISGCTQLKELYCYNNILTALDVSGCTQLTKVYCHDNKLSTDALDDIYCALPDRKDSINGVIQPVDNSSSTYNDTVIASNAANATAKNWKVQYYSNDADIPATTGKHKCSATDIADASAEQALTLYPNPVADVLYLSATARTIRVYDIYGTEVAHATDTDRVEVSHLPSGVYTVNADGTVAKMVKR